MTTFILFPFRVLAAIAVFPFLVAWALIGEFLLQDREQYSLVIPQSGHFGGSRHTH